MAGFVLARLVLFLSARLLREILIFIIFSFALVLDWTLIWLNARHTSRIEQEIEKLRSNGEEFVNSRQATGEDIVLSAADHLNLDDIAPLFINIAQAHDRSATTGLALYEIWKRERKITRWMELYLFYHM